MFKGVGAIWDGVKIYLSQGVTYTSHSLLVVSELETKVSSFYNYQRPRDQFIFVRHQFIH